MVGVGKQSLTRGVLGTAPVAEDGSAHFQVPTDVPIYFQALDENGLAVQSMRSATYVHPGERLSCVGCHEPKQQAPAYTSTVPLAWQQAPTKLQPAHHDVRLDPEEMRRITLWLDCNSNFYGAYHDLRAPGEGRKVEPAVR